MWAILDDDAGFARLRQPILVELRRRLEGWRMTEQLADELCLSLTEADPAEEPRLRVQAAARVAEATGQPVGPEFDEDWASGLLLGGLNHLRKTHPRAHSLLLRTYDRPEGAPPFTPHELAVKLARPEQEVEHDLAEGRAELHKQFREQVLMTLADESLLEEELARLEPHAAKAFG